MGKRIRVDPCELRLPPARSEGADWIKLSRQIQNFGASTEGMPPLLVVEGRDGELMLLDGVTRAIRICMLRPGSTLAAELVEIQARFDLSSLPKVRERIPG